MGTYIKEGLKVALMLIYSLSRQMMPFKASKYNFKQVGPKPGSNSKFKCILGPKRFWVKKSVGSKKFVFQKDFGSKKRKYQNNFSAKKIWIQK